MGASCPLPMKIRRQTENCSRILVSGKLRSRCVDRSIQLARKEFAPRNGPHRFESYAICRSRHDVPDELNGAVAKQEVRAGPVLAGRIVQVPAGWTIVGAGMNKNEVPSALAKFTGDSIWIKGALIAIASVNCADPGALDIGERAFLDEDRIAGPVRDGGEAHLAVTVESAVAGRGRRTGASAAACGITRRRGHANGVP